MRLLLAVLAGIIAHFCFPDSMNMALDRVVSVFYYFCSYYEHALICSMFGGLALSLCLGNLIIICNDLERSFALMLQLSQDPH